MSFFEGDGSEARHETAEKRDGVDVREYVTEDVETIAGDPDARGREDGQIITICSTADDFDRKWITAEARDSWVYLEDMA